MNPELRKYLLSLNCTVINPVLERLGSMNEVGWHCKSSNRLRVEDNLKKIRSYILENKLDYYIEEGNEYTAEFFIYKK